MNVFSCVYRKTFLTSNSWTQKEKQIKKEKSTHFGTFPMPFSDTKFEGEPGCHINANFERFALASKDQLKSGRTDDTVKLLLTEIVKVPKKEWQIKPAK